LFGTYSRSHPGKRIVVVFKRRRIAVTHLERLLASEHVLGAEHVSDRLQLGLDVFSTESEVVDLVPWNRLANVSLHRGRHTFRVLVKVALPKSFELNRSKVFDGLVSIRSLFLPLADDHGYSGVDEVVHDLALELRLIVPRPLSSASKLIGRLIADPSASEQSDGVIVCELMLQDVDDLGGRLQGQAQHHRVLGRRQGTKEWLQPIGFACPVDAVRLETAVAASCLLVVAGDTAAVPHDGLGDFSGVGSIGGFALRGGGRGRVASSDELRCFEDTVCDHVDATGEVVTMISSDV